MNDFFTWIESHPHTTTLITTLISVLLAITGWFFISWKNRKIEIEKLRLPYRTETLRNTIYGIVSLVNSKTGILDNAHKKMLEQANIDIQMIGTEKENILWRNFVNSLQSGPCERKLAHLNLINELQTALRKEFDLNPLSKDS